MNREEDVLYYVRRAQEERARAESASDPAAQSVHRTLADEYQRRVGGSQTAQ